jgi:hypoxanthine phosphoribosyltransferase
VSGIDPGEARVARERAERLASAEEVAAALARMAVAITARLGDRNPLLLAVMTGGMVPAGLLVPQLDFPFELDYLQVSRYRDTIRGGELEWRHHPARPLSGRHVLVIDDILDEGWTLQAIVAACRDEGAAAVLSAVLVEKRRPRDSGAVADFIGLELPDRYLFGYGMDYGGYLRGAPGIYAVDGH